MVDRVVADTVARHKSCFFIEKDRDGQIIDYAAATSGHLKIVPEGEAKAALAKDYAAMLADEVMVGDAVSFDKLLEACAGLEAKVNEAAAKRKIDNTRLEAPCMLQDGGFNTSICRRRSKSEPPGVRRISWTGYAMSPRLLRYSTGLRAPREILIRFSLYQRMYVSKAWVNCSTLAACQSRG